MNLGGIDLNLLVAFDALMRHRHVTRAAAAVGSSQPAMSGALSRLRLLFDDRLLVRGAAGMVPTPRALELHQAIRPALDALARAFEDADSFTPGNARRTFRLAMAENAAFYILPGLIARLAREAPGISLIVLPTAHVPGVELVSAGEAELSVGLMPRQPGGDILVEPVFRERLVCVGRNGHPAFRRQTLHLRDYLAHAHIAVQPSVRATSRVDIALAALGEQRRVQFTVPHFLLVPFLLSGSDLIATAAERVVAYFAPSADLEVRDAPFDIPAHEVYLAWHRLHDRDLGHKWLRAAIIAEAAKL